ncbi:MAG: hypothetical protein O3C28_03500 [Proteobacteria bacterium]|nr:hypothetical protein [Pseudomonadota bacterium]
MSNRFAAQATLVRNLPLVGGPESQTKRALRLLVVAIIVAAEFGLPQALSASAAAREPVYKAESFLSFEDQADGRCQNLSSGGKLTVIRNAHPTKTIRFRLIRYFVDVRQEGRATGVLLPDSEPAKIGCNRVDGRRQRWVVEKAEFLSEQSP